MRSGSPRMRRGDEVALDLRGAAHDALGPAVQVHLQPGVVAAVVAGAADRERRRGRRPARSRSSAACRPIPRVRGRCRRGGRRAGGCTWRRSISASTMAQPRSRTLLGAVRDRARSRTCATSCFTELACSGRRSPSSPGSRSWLTTVMASAPALARLADHVGGRHPGAVEEDLAELLGDAVDHLQRALLDAGLVASARRTRRCPCAWARRGRCGRARGTSRRRRSSWSRPCGR